MTCTSDHAAQYASRLFFLDRVVAAVRVIDRQVQDLFVRVFAHEYGGGVGRTAVAAYRDMYCSRLRPV